MKRKSSNMEREYGGSGGRQTEGWEEKDPYARMYGDDDEESEEEEDEDLEDDDDDDEDGDDDEDDEDDEDDSEEDPNY